MDFGRRSENAPEAITQDTRQSSVQTSGGRNNSLEPFPAGEARRQSTPGSSALAAARIRLEEQADTITPPISETAPPVPQLPAYKGGKRQAGNQARDVGPLRPKGRCCSFYPLQLGRKLWEKYCCGICVRTRTRRRSVITMTDWDSVQPEHPPRPHPTPGDGQTRSSRNSPPANPPANPPTSPPASPPANPTTNAPASPSIDHRSTRSDRNLPPLIVDGTEASFATNPCGEDRYELDTIDHIRAAQDIIVLSGIEIKRRYNLDAREYVFFAEARTEDGPGCLYQRVQDPSPSQREPWIYYTHGVVAVSDEPRPSKAPMGGALGGLLDRVTRESPKHVYLTRGGSKSNEDVAPAWKLRANEWDSFKRRGMSALYENDDCLRHKLF